MTDKDKALGLFRLALNDIMQPFGMYGQAVFFAEAIRNIEAAALELHERLNGERA